jgi:hypothetical protein
MNSILFALLLPTGYLLSGTTAFSPTSPSFKVAYPSLQLGACSLQPFCRLQPPSPGDSMGIEGLVYTVSGNQMPSPHRKPGPHKGIRSTIYVFTLTGNDQVIRLEGSPFYYSAIKTRMVRQVDTDSNGYFNLLLPAGAYSIFTKKGDLFYASRRDDKNNIAPVEVLPGKMTRVDCQTASVHPVFY